MVMGEKGWGRGGVIVHLPLRALSLPPEIIMSTKTLIVRRVSSWGRRGEGWGRGEVIVHLPLHALSLPPEIIMSPKTLIVRTVSR